MMTRTAATSRALRYWVGGLMLAALLLASTFVPLRRTTTPVPAQPALIVLPLHAAGANTPEQTQLAEQLSRDLVAQLARVQRLRVIGASSAARAQADKFDLEQLAESLHVNYALDGSLRRAGGQLLIELRLNAVPDGRILWAQAYTRDPEDFFALEADIADAIAQALELKRNTQRTTRVVPQYLLAYAAARHAMNSGDRAAAITQLRTLVAQAPDFAPAHAALARALAAELRREEPSAEDVETVEAHAQRALELDPQLAEAHVARAILACRAGEWSRCMATFRRATELDPSDTESRIVYTNWMAGLGFVAAAMREAETVWTADPFSYDANFTRGRLLDTLGRHDEAKQFFDAATPASPGLIYARWHNALWRKDLNAARELAAAMPQSDGFRESYLGITEASADPSRWAQVQPLIGTSERATGRVNVLRIMLPNPDYRLEIEGLERMLRAGWPSYHLLLWMPEYAALRADPAFGEFLVRTHIIDYWRSEGFPPQCRAEGDRARCD